MRIRRCKRRRSSACRTRAWVKWVAPTSTLKTGFSATEEELIEWCKERCANFRVPRYLRIVADFESIGMTASGKVQKTKLREHALRELKL